MKNLHLTFNLFVFLLCVIPMATIAQNNSINNKRGFEVEFVNRKTEQSSNELSSNILKIRNNSGNQVAFSVNISAPDGWRFLSKKTNQYTVKPYDSVFVPVNLIPQRISKGNVNHVINASLINDNNNQFASAIWYMNIKKESNWNASAVKNKIFFLNQSDTTSFAVRLQNLGNAEEKIKISFSSDRRIRVLDQGIEIKYHNITLPVNRDTTLCFTAEKLKPIQNTFREDFDITNTALQSKVFSLRVIVQNETDGTIVPKTWRGAIDFIEASTEAWLKQKSVASLPLTIEATIDNFLENSTMLNLSMYGNANLEKNRYLNYRFQTFFIDNFYNYKSFLGHSHYIGYTSPNTSVEIGDVNGNVGFGFTPTGKGIKASQQIFKNNYFGAFYLRGPYFFNDHTKTENGLSYELRLRRSSFENYLQFTDNSLLNFTGTQYSNRIKFNLFRFHNFIFNTAFSSEKYNGTSAFQEKAGYAYNVTYSGSFRKLNLSLNNSFGSKYNTGYRGIQTLGADIQYRLNKFNSINGGFFNFSQNPEYFSSAGLLLSPLKNLTERYEIKYNYIPFEYSLSLKLQHLYNEVFNLRTESNGLGIDYRPRPKGDMRFFLSLLGAYVKLLDYDINPYFAGQIRTTVRYKSLNTSLRYFYGPYQAYEQMLFATSKINNQSIFSNTNIKFWLLKNSVSFEPSFIYSYENLFKRSRISLRPEIFYMPKSGTEFKFYAQYINNNQKNNPFLHQAMEIGNINPVITSSNLFFGLGIKKKLGVPVSGKKYKNLTVLIFKDINGNNRQDKNEPGLKNILVNIKAADSSYFNNGLKEIGENFVTDENGKVVYKNLPRGVYRISILPLSETDGFFAGNEQVVMVDNDVVFPMPLNQGVHLSGALTIERDVTAADLDRKIDVSKIRITAMDSLGKTYSTLTDANGRFDLRLPVGVYQVSVNENALPDNFELEHKRIMVEMYTVANNYNITFLLREKKRKINIKRFDQQGKLLSE